MKKFDLEAAQHRTIMQKSRMEDYAKYFSDPDKNKRILEQECILCYYDSRIGGAAMTDSNCLLCEKIMHFGSTCVDNLCQPCAEKHKLCKHCGADINYKKRNKL